MEPITTTLYMIAGLLLRLAIPLGLTAILIILLRKLDARWQAEAHLPTLAAQKVECWKFKNCTAEQRADCVGANSALPCWQAKRLPNGYLLEECLTCEVFTKAPAPQLNIEPRRM
jgi:hypothetical protein